MPQVVIDATFVNKAAKLLKKHPGRVERVQRTLGLLAVDPLDPVVRTKKYDKQLDIWQSYIEQGTGSSNGRCTVPVMMAGAVDHTRPLECPGCQACRCRCLNATRFLCR